MKYNHTLTKLVITFILFLVCCLIGLAILHMYQSSTYHARISYEMRLKGGNSEFLYTQYQRCIKQVGRRSCLNYVAQKADFRNIPVAYQYFKADLAQANTFGCRFKVVYLNAYCLNGVEQDKGFANKGFLYYQKQLKEKYHSLGQFCINGSALILSGQDDYAKQYEKDFGYCIKNIVRIYRLSMITKDVHSAWTLQSVNHGLRVKNIGDNI